MAEHKGYPMGWSRVPGTDYEHYETLEWFAFILDVNPHDAKIFPGSYANIRVVGEVGSISFSEADKAWYKPYPRIGL